MTSSSSYGQPKASGIWVRCYLPRAGTYEGKQEIANVFAQVEQTLEFTEFTPREMIEQGDTVVVLGTLAGRAKSRHGSCHAENQVDCLILAHRGHSTKK
jgi:ketosteroid isomerase-like protein